MLSSRNAWTFHQIQVIVLLLLCDPGLFIFSTAMRKICCQTLVRADHDGADNFLHLRDETRRKGLIYTEVLLPKTEDMVKKIKDFASEIDVSDFDDWEGDLKKITEGATVAEEACKSLVHLYEKLIIEMKQKEDAATLSAKDLGRLKQIYEEENERLLNAAALHKHKKEKLQRLGLFLALPTLGIGTWLTKSKAKREQKEIDKSLSAANVAKQKGEKLTKTAKLTDFLIPAILSFLTGLTSCCAFLTTTRTELSELREKGTEGQESTWKKRTVNLLRKHANEVESDCKVFISSSTRIRTDLKAIPSEPSDENYVQQWCADQIASLMLCVSQ